MQEQIEGKVFWLDGFNGLCKGGVYVRSKIAVELEHFEKKFGRKIVAIGLGEDESGRPSFNLHLIVEADDSDGDAVNIPVELTSTHELANKNQNKE